MENIRKKRIQRGLIFLVLFTLLITVAVSLNRRSGEEEAEKAVVEVEESAVIPLEEEVRSAESVVYSHQRESRKVFNDGFPLGDHEQLKDVHRDLEEDFQRRIEPEPVAEPEPETEPETQPEPKPEPIVVAAAENADPEDKNENKEKETKNEETTEKKSEEKEEKKEITDLSVHPGIYNIKGTSSNLSDSVWKWRREIVDLAAENREIVKINGDITKKLVALTFDDGPDGNITPRVMKVLGDYNVKGNFFFTGRNVEVHPAVVKKAHQEGHMVLSHSYYHPNYNNLSYAEIDKDFRRTNKAIEGITGTYPVFMRPPFGIVNENVIKAAREHQQKIIIWSTDSMDWAKRNKENIVRNVLENVRPGEIILMHSPANYEATVQALPEIIEGLIAKGYRIVRLDEM